MTQMSPPPFNPSPAPASDAGAGQSQTKAIISMVCGILSLVTSWTSFCCPCIFVLPLALGAAALVLGWMAKADMEKGLAPASSKIFWLVGMITGGVALLLGVVLVIVSIALNGLNLAMQSH